MSGATASIAGTLSSKEHESILAKTAVIDFAAGMITGWVQVLTLQPLDMIKTTMQASPKTQSIFSCCVEIYQQKQLRGFYKGMQFQLLGTSLFSALYFGSNEQFKKLFISLSAGEYEKHTQPLWQIFIAGSLAGLSTCSMSAPIEHVKIRMQTQLNGMYSSSIDCMKKIHKNHGVKGLYKSAYLQFSRNLIGCGSYFMMYEAAKRHFLEGKSESERSLNKSELLMSGLVAGMSFWPLCFPLDVIKTKMQSDCFENPKLSSVRDCLHSIYQQEGRGLRNFYKGFAITNIRTIPSSVISLYTFDQVIKLLMHTFVPTEGKHQ